jgi:hypothetical protein
MTVGTLTLLVGVLLAQSPASQRAADESVALGILKAQHPRAFWSFPVTEQADLTLDGVPDVIAKGVLGGTTLVIIIEGPVTPSSRTWTLRIPREDYCAPVSVASGVTLALERPWIGPSGLGCEFADGELCDEAREMQRVLSEKSAVGSKALVVDRGACAKIHVFFSPVSGTLQRWES